MGVNLAEMIFAGFVDRLVVVGMEFRAGGLGLIACGLLAMQAYGMQTLP